MKQKRSETLRRQVIPKQAKTMDVASTIAASVNTSTSGKYSSLPKGTQRCPVTALWRQNAAVECKAREWYSDIAQGSNNTNYGNNHNNIQYSGHYTVPYGIILNE